MRSNKMRKSVCKGIVEFRNKRTRDCQEPAGDLPLPSGSGTIILEPWKGIDQRSLNLDQMRPVNLSGEPRPTTPSRLSKAVRG
jgi:hypothetical protein